MHRWMIKPEDSRVEFVMKNAAKLVERVGPDVSEIFPQPRVAQEAVIGSYDGVRLNPGWSPNLTRDDPTIGKPWNINRCIILPVIIASAIYPSKIDAKPNTRIHNEVLHKREIVCTHPRVNRFITGMDDNVIVNEARACRNLEHHATTPWVHTWSKGTSVRKG